MTYVTNQDIEEWIGTAKLRQLTDDAASGSIDWDKVDEARTGAEGEVNSFLAGRYAVPVDVSGEPQVQAALRFVVLDLVSYRLHSRKPPAPADVVRRGQEALAWLGQVAAGTVHLPAAVAPAVNPALGLISEAAGPARAMTRDELRDV